MPGTQSAPAALLAAEAPATPPVSAPAPAPPSDPGQQPSAPEPPAALAEPAPQAPAGPPEPVRAEWFEPPVSREALDRLTVEEGRFERPLPWGANPVRYTLDPDLTQAVWKVLRRGRVALGHVVVMDVDTGALHVYASTDPERFPPQRTYPAASLVKVVTAAAALQRAPSVAHDTCRYVGSPYKLYARHLVAPASGREADLKRALATSNNQCFARIAVNKLGSDGMLAAIRRFGLLRSPALGHRQGRRRGSRRRRAGPREVG